MRLVLIDKYPRFFLIFHASNPILQTLLCIFQVLDFILNLMSDGEKKKQLSELITNKNYKLGYLKYDWGVNA